MGLGGNLLWTPMLRALSEKKQVKILVCFKPKLIDLMCLTLYDQTRDCRNFPIFNNNPYVSFNQRKECSGFAHVINSSFDKFLQISRLAGIYDRALAFFCRYFSSKPIVHIDNPVLNYMKREFPDRFEWKSGGHIIDVVGHAVGVDNLPHQCELYFSKEEVQKIDDLVTGLPEQLPFVTIEPHTHLGYFGDLRAWEVSRWQTIVDRICDAFSGIQVIQIGVPGSKVLDNVIPLMGQLSFRESALMIERSLCFLGTEGGLVHAANATGTKAVIVWGGITLPEFAGYPSTHEIVCNYVDCAPCGLKGNCPFEHKCMKSISIDQVWLKTKMVLEKQLLEHQTKSPGFS